MAVFLVLAILAILVAFGLYNYRSTRQKAHKLVEDIKNFNKQ